MVKDSNPAQRDGSMRDPLLLRILRPRRLRVDLPLPFSRSSFSVMIPDLRDHLIQAGGDWGLFYEVQLPQPVVIQELDINITEAITIESPIKFEDRRSYPLFMRLPMERLKSEVHIFFSSDGHPAYAVVRSTGSTLPRHPTFYIEAAVEEIQLEILNKSNADVFGWNSDSKRLS